MINWENKSELTQHRLCAAGLGIRAGFGAKFAQAAKAPKDNKGYTASKTTVVELGPEFEGMAGRQLQARLLTIEPGGYIGLHNHKDRPAVVYFLQGTDTGHSRRWHVADLQAQ